MDFARFLDEHRGAWRQLEATLDTVDEKGLSALPAADVRELARLYRKASADLLLVRDAATRADVVDYLENLVGRAYTAIYAPRPLRLPRIWHYLSRGWPQALRRERVYIGLAAAAMAIGALLGYAMTAADPEAMFRIVPPEISDFYGSDPGDYRERRFGGMSDDDAALFSAKILVNNARVTLLAFGLGLSLGIGTLSLLVYNGILIGAIAANFQEWGKSLPFWALILPHGVAEIFAIVLGGASGLVLADAILRPGRRRRRDALRERGLDAIRLGGVAAPLLGLAALIEGYLTPLELLPDAGKLGFAALSALALLLWARAPWLRGAADGGPADYSSARSSETESW